MNEFEWVKKPQFKEVKRVRFNKINFLIGYKSARLKYTSTEMR